MGNLSTDLRAWLRDITFFLANGSLDVAEELDYRPLLAAEPAFLEQCLALWSNVIEVDEKGKVVNGEQAQHRVAQYVRTWVDKGFRPEPPFESWEMELH